MFKMRSLIRHIGSMAFLVAMVAFTTAASKADDDLGFNKFAGSSGPQEEGIYVATSPEGWHKLWSMVGKPAKATFVPGKNTGVGIFLGPRPDGDRLRVRNVQDDDGRIEVKLNHKHGTPSGETITPWAIVLVKGTGSEVVADIRHEASPVD